MELKQEMFPRREALEEVSILSKIKTEEFILGASDDYELLFTCSPDHIGTVNSILSGFNCPVTHIGDIVHQEQGMTLITNNEERKTLLKEGWDHFSV